MESIAALVAIHTMSGAGTIYLGPVGNRLLCDRPDSPLVYSEATPPWVALSLESDFECWDLVLVREHRPDGTTRSFMARALDSGAFGNHTVIGGLPIVVDGPPHVVTWPAYPGWAEVEVVNLSAVARACRERGWCDGST